MSAFERTLKLHLVSYRIAMRSIRCTTCKHVCLSVGYERGPCKTAEPNLCVYGAVFKFSFLVLKTLRDALYLVYDIIINKMK